MHIDKQILDKANEWLTPTFDSKTKEEIEKAPKPERKGPPKK